MFKGDLGEKEPPANVTPRRGDEHLRQLGVLTRLGEVSVLGVTPQSHFLEKTHNAAAEAEEEVKDGFFFFF